MRFKIYSFIFIFVACFLLFSYTPIQGGMQQKPVYQGDKFEGLEEGFETKIVELNEFYENRQFKEIGKFYKDTGKIMAYDLQAVQERGKIAAYFKWLYDEKKVRDLTFIAKSVYAKELEANTTVRKLLKKGIIRGKDIPDDVDLSNKVTHSLHAIISVEFTLPGVERINNGHGSFWDGWHIDGCPIF